MTTESTCPPDDTLALFAEGALPPSDTEALAAHSESCAACRRVLAALARLRSSREGVDVAGPAGDALSGSQLGRYLVRRPVGAGAMGVVYEAFDPALERRLAVKVLRGAQGEREQARLQREGQVMAKLSHRNVATVFDVGQVHGQAWVAMEYVDGVTLRHWLRAAKRSPQETLAALLDAGHGLAAAHRQGLVHRDFKPDNVLVESTGRVVVTDFGLASDASAPAEVHGPHALASPLQTRTGALVGTPAYMALEQLEGRPADARSDQFAFCVTCVEAFSGRRPWDAKELEPLKDALRSQRPDDAALAQVPRRLRAALVRGLAAKPDARFESMDALLAALAPPPRGRTAAIGAVAGVTAVALVAGAWTTSRARVCSGAEAKLTGVWDGPAKDATRSAFNATGLPFAEAAAAGLEASLDVWARDWRQAWTQACEDTRVRGVASEELLDLRMSCLSERLAEVRSLSQVMTHADADAVRAASGAMQRLSPLAACADEKALKSPVPPPADPVQAQRVDALREELAHGVALRAAGRYRDAKGVADGLVTAAGALAYRPLEAEALILQGQLLEDLDDFDGASAALESAVRAAQAGGHLRAAGQGWALLTRVDGEKRAKYADGHRAAGLAAAVLERLGSPAELAVLLARNLADLLSEEGRHADARAELERALALQRALDPDGVQVAATLNALGVELRQLGEKKASLAYHEEALALLTARLGPSHPDVAMVQKNIGNYHWSQSELDEALTWYEKALALQRAALGEDSLEVASTRNNVASVYIRQQRLVEAEAALRDVIRVMGARLGESHPRLFGQLNNLAVVLRFQQKNDEAKTTLLRALEVAEKAHGPEHGDVATTLINLGDVQLASRDFAASVKSYERAVAITLKTAGPDHPDLAECYGGLAFPLLQLKEWRRALEATDKSLAILAKGEGNPLVAAQVHFAHAQASWETAPGRRAAAVAEAKAAREVLVGSGAQASDLVEVDTWLARHR